MIKYVYFGLIMATILQCKPEPKGLKKIEGKQIKIATTNQPNTELIKSIQPYKDSLNNIVNEVLCYNPTVLSRLSGALESNLGNLYADICYERINPIYKDSTGHDIDFALFNFGGIRTDVPKGEVKVNDLFKLMPFENKLVVVELTPDKIKALINYLQNRKEAHPVSNIKLQLKDNQLDVLNINGKPYNSNSNYRVLTHDYLQHGGDNMVFFTEPKNLFNSQIKVRDALINYFKSQDTLHAKLDGRFIKL